MPFVVDASATLPWCFEEEATPWTEQLLSRLSLGEQVLVPAHWPVEVANSLIMAVRRKRIDSGRPEWFLGKLYSLPILVEPPLSRVQMKAVYALCLKHNLTFYDGAYLELAKRTGFELATLDSALLRAAITEQMALAR